MRNAYSFWSTPAIRVFAPSAWVRDMRNSTAFWTTGPKSFAYGEGDPGYSPWARNVSTARAVFATSLAPLCQEPTLVCVSLSHQRTLRTQASVVGSPIPAPPFVAAPMEPGVLEDVMDLNMTGDSTIATVLSGAGLTETCWDGGEGIGVTSVIGPGFGTSTSTSTSSGISGSSGGSGSSSGTSSCCGSARAIVRSNFFFSVEDMAVITMRTITKSVTDVMAMSGAASRWSSILAILYSRESRGALNPENMSFRRWKKFLCSYFSPSSSRSTVNSSSSAASAMSSLSSLISVSPFPFSRAAKPLQREHAHAV